ncbi:Phosphoribosyl-ATP pyrophosphatase [Listeria grayi]|uniref:phosphoribosyl-ATP diphosphatase n=1 Tax=Listeria grayi TaxID=1641 RepID=A0A378MG83_LISGR|nr:Phosphoribosyl-ATP pyrophosphatase [Listeria grayi]
MGEETTEVVIAAKNENQELISETADLTYHLLVLLVEKGIPLSVIEEELEGRVGKISTTKDRSEITDL